MSESEQSMVPFSSTTLLMGRGFTDLDLSIPDNRASTASLLRYSLDQFEDSAAGLAAAGAGQWINGIIASRQEENRGFFERILGPSEEKKRQEEERRQTWTGVAGVIAYYGVKGLSYVTKQYLAGREKKTLGRALFRTTSFASAATGGLNKSARGRISKVCVQAGLDPSSYESEEVPHSAAEVDFPDVDEETRKALGYTCFAVAADQNGLSTLQDQRSEPRMRMENVLEVLNYTRSEQRDVLDAWAEVYAEERENLSEFTGSMSQLVTDVQFRINGQEARDTILDQAAAIASYNPYEERRKKQLKKIRGAVGNYGPLALSIGAQAVAGPVGDAAITTGLAFCLNNVSRNEAGEQSIIESFRTVCENQGLHPGRSRRLAESAKRMADL
jgi:hypothetical protein